MSNSGDATDVRKTGDDLNRNIDMNGNAAGADMLEQHRTTNVKYPRHGALGVEDANCEEADGEDTSIALATEAAEEQHL